MLIFEQEQCGSNLDQALNIIITLQNQNWITISFNMELKIVY